MEANRINIEKIKYYIDLVDCRIFTEDYINEVGMDHISLRNSKYSEAMVTFGEAIRLGKMGNFTDDFKQLTGEEAITVKYMFEHADDFQVGERHSEDN